MKKVLIVEDEKNIILTLEMYLKKAGYKVLIVNNGIDAVKKVQEQLPDLVLLDILLPGMNGYLVCEAIKQENNTKHIPVIIISAKNQDSDVEKAYSMGADDYIIKPFTHNQIDPIIKKYLMEEESNEKIINS